MTSEQLDTILTALHERRNRLIQLDVDSKVHDGSIPKLRHRITECNAAIRAIKQEKEALSAITYL